MVVSSMESTAISPTTSDLEILESLIQQYNATSLQNEKASQQYSPFRYFPRLDSIPLLRSLLPPKDETKELIQALLLEQKTCTSYKRWYEISLQLDELQDHNSWKEKPESDIYDYDLIYSNLEEMKNARLSNDYKLLLYVIRTKWIRNLGNMNDINLYRHSYVGTKKLIEDYIEECKLSLEYLINGKGVNLEDSYLLGTLIQTRRNIGRTALVLSGGSTFGVFHVGVLITLIEANLLPRIISGSSAGSIMASILCCHTNEETPELLNGITSKSFNIFGSSDPKDNDQGTGPVPGSNPQETKFKTLLNHLSHLIKYGTFFDMSGLKKTMIDFIGDLTFREAYNRTGKILNITVSPASIHEQTRLLNYLTAPHCLIWSAVCASCSLPGFFPSNSIYEKIPRTNEVREWNNDTSMKFVDGSVDNDLPITRLSEMFNVDNIIAVQVNPHVVPILKVSVGNVGGEIENYLSSRFKNFLNNVYDFMSCEVIHYLQLLNEMDIYKNLSNKAISILSQNYSGDITILADYKPSDFLKVFDNPTPEFLLDFITRGVRASWPKVTVINNYCGVEFALDKAIGSLRGRIISQVKFPNVNNKHRKSISIGDKIETKVKQPPLLAGANASQNLYTLVNSPVLNDDAIKQYANSSTPERNSRKKPPPEFKRHYTSTDITRRKSNGSSKSTGSSLGVSKHSKRNFPRGKSTTSLSSLTDKKVQNSPSSDDTLINDDEGKGDNKERALVKRSNSMDGKGDIRKAKSQANFSEKYSQAFRRSPSMKSKYLNDRYSRYKEPSYSDAASWNNYRHELGPPKKPDFSDLVGQNKANFPKISQPNSVRNSYIGLNRLKDSYVTSPGNAHESTKPIASPSARKVWPHSTKVSNYLLSSLDTEEGSVSYGLTGKLENDSEDESVSPGSPNEEENENTSDEEKEHESPEP